MKWIPDQADFYFYINSEGVVAQGIWQNHKIDWERRNSEGIYKTKEEANLNIGKTNKKGVLLEFKIPQKENTSTNPNTLKYVITDLGEIVIERTDVLWQDISHLCDGEIISAGFATLKEGKYTVFGKSEYFGMEADIKNDSEILSEYGYKYDLTF